MHATECLPFDEVFTHVADDGTVRHFNASAMERKASSLLRQGRIDLIKVAMDPDFVAFVKERRGVEEWKLTRLVEPYLSRPVIGVDMLGGSVLTVDGHHRLVVLHAQGKEDYMMYRFPLGQWESFVVCGIKEDMADFMVAVATQGQSGG